jgi:holo-[acyl-carrier protein] synthase
MIVGVGLDLVAVATLAPNLQRARYLARVFTPAEVAASQGTARPAETFAGKFAAKEAFMKALGAGLRQGICFTDVEVLAEASGQPRLRVIGGAARQRLDDLQVTAIHVTITHTAGLAASVVILEDGPVANAGARPTP